MPPVLTRNGDHLEIALGTCRGFEFQDAKEKVRALPGRRWDPESKNWIVPADPAIAERVLKSLRPEAPQDVIDWITASKAQAEEALTTPLPDDAELRLPWANKRLSHQPFKINDKPFNGLLPFQRAAVDAIAETGRAILADDMGLGKTIEAIATVEEWCLRNGQPDGPKLVVAPASVKGGWLREIKRFLGDDAPAVVVKGSYSKRKAKAEDIKRLGLPQDTEELSADQVRSLVIQDAIDANAWIIVNWEQLRLVKVKKKLRNGGTKTVKVMKEPLFESTEWLAVIADEAHRAKNKDAQQTQGLWRCQGSVMIAATGTPIMNSPDEIWSLLRWLWPDEYHDRGEAHAPGAMAYWPFYNEYVDYWEDHNMRKIVTGVRNPDALRFVLKGKLYRRTAEILGLKGRQRIYDSLALNPAQQKLYDEAEDAMWLQIVKDAEEGDEGAKTLVERLKDGVDASTMLRIPNGAARMVRLQQIIENPALIGGPDDSALMDYFVEKAQDSRPEPWVFFCKFRESTELLANRLRKCRLNVAVYHGDVSPVDRTKIEDAFQRGEIDVIVGTIGAMKEGVTLTASHLMGFLTRDWVPDVNEQCESREDRLGQAKLVRVFIPQAEGTVAVEKVEPTNRTKERIVRTVLPKLQIKEV